jgi:hypothetical protein
LVSIHGMFDRSIPMVFGITFKSIFLLSIIKL